LGKREGKGNDLTVRGQALSEKGCGRGSTKEGVSRKGPVQIKIKKGGDLKQGASFKLPGWPPLSPTETGQKHRQRREKCRERRLVEFG